MSDVGSRKNGHNEEWFRVLVEQAADGIFISSAEGIYLEVNPSGNRLLGYAPGELIGKRIGDIVRLEDRGRLERAIKAILQGEVQTQEWTVLRKDGSIVDVELTAQRVGDGSILAIARDLTPRRLAEDKMQSSEAQLRSILLTAPDVIMAVDRAGKILFINRTLPPLTPARVVGTICFDYVPVEARPRVEAALEKVFSTRTLDEYEIAGPPGPDGVRRWASVRAGPMVEDDEVVAAILCATDVTARRKDEERILELALRLERISRQVSGIVYQARLSPDGSWSVPYVSERIREICLLSPEDVRDDPSKILALLHPEDRERVVLAVTASARTLEPTQDEYRITLADGNVRWLHASAAPEREPDGSVVCSGYVHDIGARKEAERHKAQLEEQLRQSQKVESIGRLAGGVAHDFNNLLTSIMGFGDLARRALPPGSPAVAYLAGVQESAERGAALTQQLLAFARQKVVRPVVIGLNDVLQGTTALLQRLVGEHLELVLVLAPGAGLVKVDVGSLEQVIMNLVVNARDAILGMGRITLETFNVVLDAEVSRTHADAMPGEYVVLAVTDTGSGMAPGVRARAFEPFFTTKPVGQGTGLGLAMCHGIVTQAGGRIEVDSAPGAGSTFRVYLPRASGVPAAAPAPPARVTSPKRHGTILLVEDERAILRLSNMALASFGYRVLTATNGVEALELVKATNEPIHLLITDVVMPKMGGSELAAKLAALRPGIRVLFSSGYMENSIVEHGVLAEGLNFIQKPYTPTALAERVREVLEKPDV
ncbi:MAG TPA: PAS domain S-box protein [Polyangiaceae bacterium]|nr:PAS domain S-box protein [Polyangiaceae bacterium]